MLPMHGSFNISRAIRGLSTPALSKRISKLEQDLGRALIHRTTKTTQFDGSKVKVYTFMPKT